MSFTVTVERVFAAAHAIRMPDGKLESLHGHNWGVRVTVGRGALDATGFVVDFHDLERSLDAILSRLHNSNLNDTLPLNPTAEHVALHIGRELLPPPGAKLRWVEVTEAPGCVARYEPD
jgi:6-pyruvoyltetrahydropterin/6-carboxytetrahydropterin synthase